MFFQRLKLLCENWARIHKTFIGKFWKIEIKTAWLGLRFIGAFWTTRLMPDLSGSWLVKAAGQDVNVVQPVLHAAN